MNSELSMNSVASATPIKVFKYRWIILTIYVLVALINFMQLLQFSIIADVIKKFYDVPDYWVDMTGLVFFISYIVFFYPASFLIEKYSLKLTVIAGIALTLAGNVLKLVAAQPDRMWVVIVAQFLVSVGQVAISSIPSKLATTWFGSEEVSTACAIAVLGLQLGTALGCVQSPFVVKKGDNDQIANQLFDMFLYQAIATACIFVITLAFFRSKPNLPPSQSQLNIIESDANNVSFFTNMTKMAQNKNYWLIVFSLGLANGVWNTFGVLINNLYLHYFPNGESDVGLISLITIISGGCIGSMFFGTILDKTHYFKQVSFGVLVASSLTFVLVVVSLLEKSRVMGFIVIPIFGFFIAPVLILGFEYLVEVTHPIPEACSSSTFNAAFYFLSIVLTLLFEALFDIIGYDYTFIVIFIILVISAVVILFVNSDLKRRDANLQHNALNGNVANDANGYSTATSSTTVTVSRF